MDQSDPASTDPTSNPDDGVTDLGAARLRRRPTDADLDAVLAATLPSRPADPAPGQPRGDLLDEADAGPEPVLDPEIEARITALLAAPLAGDPSDPSHTDSTHPSHTDSTDPARTDGPGPMPARFADRIAEALADEARLRVDPGPLTAAQRSSTTAPHHAFSRPRPRSRTWLAVASVAAAAAVVAVGGSALHLNKRPSGVAAVQDSLTGSPTATPTPGAPAPGAARLHIQLSTTAYDGANLETKAADLLARPAAPLKPLDAESPSVGPIGTQIGLSSCLEALGVSDPTAVSADLATYRGNPAAVVVVTRDSTSEVWVVERSCRPGAPGIIRTATSLP